MIQIDNIEVRYGDKIALDSISASFAEGLCHGIAGLNGAGKTSFFNVMSGILKPLHGTIQVNNQTISKKDIVYLETTNYFYSGITGNEYLKIFKQTNEQFDLTGLQKLFKLPLDELIENYSTGMKKKLALLAVLKKDKNVYLFDEPFNSLDLETNKILELIIQALKEKGKTIFISSHIIDPLFIVCDEIHYMDNGRFTHTFPRNEFNKLEGVLFDKLKDNARAIISGSV